MAEVSGKSVPLATAREVAERLSASERTVRRYAENGVLPAVRVGGLLRFDQRDVEAVIASGRRR